MKKFRASAAWSYWLNRRSLRFQLLSRSLLILAGLLALIGMLQYVLMKNFLYHNEAESIPMIARVPARAVIETRPRETLLFQGDNSIAWISPSGEFRDITGADEGTVSPRLPADEYKRLLTERHRRNADFRVVRNNEGTELLVVFRPTGPGGLGGLIQLGTPTAPIKAVALQQLFIFAGLSLVALAFGLALYLPALRRALRPLQQMVDTVERTDAGNLDERFPVGQGQEEIDRLAESFNGMLGRLASSFEAERAAKDRMRRFIADASHELRTPLTSIHGFLEVLLRGAADKREQLYAALRSMHGESVRIKKLVEDLLLLAKLDSEPRPELRATDLAALAAELEPHLRMLAGSRTLRFRLDPGTHAACDPDQIKQVVYNLFQNAVQHTDPERGTIEVTVRRDGAAALLEVTDNGPGIEEQHLSRLFDRFYRVDASRTRKLGGAGLGLSISASIAAAHGGSLAAASTVGRGSTFALRLPASALE